MSGQLSILRKIKGVFYRLLINSRPQIISVPISLCRHYCGFRYGTKSLNPYEQYIKGLHQRQPINQLRKEFEWFLMHYRPQNFGDVFGLQLANNIPLWLYPWNNSNDFPLNNGWIENIDEVPDIITHFCGQGIKRSQILQEYFWLERAYKEISNSGYQPLKYSYIEVIELKKKNQSVFIVKDGNHRLSALSALGHIEVKVKMYLFEQIKEEKYCKWRQISIGKYTEKDALAVFNSYFVGIDSFIPSSQPALIIE